MNLGTRSQKNCLLKVSSATQEEIRDFENMNIKCLVPRLERLSSNNVKAHMMPNNMVTVDGKTWIAGDIAWARLGKHPYWPCFVVKNPLDNKLMKTEGRNTQMIHVQFFGDNGRHSWVSARNMMTFVGKQDFVEKFDKLKTESKRGKTVLKPFCPRHSVMSTWTGAVAEAETFSTRNRETILEYFRKEFPMHTNKTVKRRWSIQSIVQKKSSPVKENTVETLLKRRRTLPPALDTFTSKTETSSDPENKSRKPLRPSTEAVRPNTEVQVAVQEAPSHVRAIHQRRKSQVPSPHPAANWEMGDIVWARIGRFPYWPAIVFKDPVSKDIMRIRNLGASNQQSFHVYFFADNGRHSWVTSSHIMKFEGIEAFNQKREELLNDIKKKDTAAFNPRGAMKMSWGIATGEAEKFLTKTQQQRINELEELYSVAVNGCTPESKEVKAGSSAKQLPVKEDPKGLTKKITKLPVAHPVSSRRKSVKKL